MTLKIGALGVEIRNYVRAIRRYWPVVLASALLFGLLAAGYSIVKSPEYEAKTKVFVSAGSAASISDLNQANDFTQQVVQSYVGIVTTPMVLTPVIAALDLDITEEELAENVSASAEPATVVIEIAATDTTAEGSARIANAVADSLAAAVSELAPAAADSGAAIRVTTVQVASIPRSPSSPGPLLLIALGLIAGLGIGVLAALARTLLDTRVRNAQDVTAVTTTPVLGVIAHDPKAKTRPLIVHDDRLSARAEAFRTFRTNLQYLDFDGRERSFVFTSAMEGEGKTTTIANLALALADGGRTVVLVDADLRRPRIAETMGVEGAVGLSDVLIGRVSVDDALQPWGHGGLQVLAAGRIPPNPSELLGSQAAADTIDRLVELFDVVLIDSPPLLSVSDAAILSKQTGGTIVAVAAGRTTKAQLSGALDMLEALKCETVGVVLTKVPTKGPHAATSMSAYSANVDAEREQTPTDRA